MNIFIIIIIYHYNTDTPVSISATCPFLRAFANPRMSWMLLRVTGFVNTLHPDVTLRSDRR